MAAIIQGTYALMSKYSVYTRTCSIAPYFGKDSFLIPGQIDDLGLLASVRDEMFLRDMPYPNFTEGSESLCIVGFIMDKSGELNTVIKVTSIKTPILVRPAVAHPDILLMTDASGKMTDFVTAAFLRDPPKTFQAFLERSRELCRFETRISECYAIDLSTVQACLKGKIQASEVIHCDMMDHGQLNAVLKRNKK